MHANFASVLGSIFDRFLVNFGSENGAKMDTKFDVLGQCFFDTIFLILWKVFFEIFTYFRIML